MKLQITIFSLVSLVFVWCNEQDGRENKVALNCIDNRERSGTAIYNSGNCSAGYDGDRCKINSSFAQGPPPQLNITGLNLTKNVEANAICMNNIQIRRGEHMGPLEGFHTRILIREKDEKNEFLELTQIQTEFLFNSEEERPRTPSELKAAGFCIELDIDLEPITNSTTVEIVGWITSLPAVPTNLAVEALRFNSTIDKIGYTPRTVEKCLFSKISSTPSNVAPLHQRSPVEKICKVIFWTVVPGLCILSVCVLYALLIIYPKNRSRGSNSDRVQLTVIRSWSANEDDLLTISQLMEN